MAQDYPTKQIRLVAGSAPGALGDIIARLVAQKISDSLGKPVIIDNQPSAGEVVAATSVARAPADGYTLFQAGSGAMTVTPFMFSNLPYDSVKAFRPVSLAAKTGLVLIARPELKSLDELLKLAKSKPNTINFASAAVGHPTHLAMEMFADRAGVRLVHIPYKGTPAALQSVIAGETSVTITGFAEALPYIKAGKVVALATTGPLPAEGFRNLPEMKQIHPDLDLSVWFAYFAPAGTPDEVISVLNREVAKAVAASDVRRRLGDFGLVPTSSTPEELDSLIAHDRARFGPLVRSLGLKAN